MKKFKIELTQTEWESLRLIFGNFADTTVWHQKTYEKEFKVIAKITKIVSEQISRDSNPQKLD